MRNWQDCMEETIQQGYFVYHDDEHGCHHWRVNIKSIIVSRLGKKTERR